ncbi:MAG: TIGR03016 family PEP-CTERM system-associated outer membrane protein [Betaproteobacteria bacterium]|nr:TIGR03016 family PEP-CTERM system-associated outer membrane protein [Betaproteobacteria bacterium]
MRKSPSSSLLPYGVWLLLMPGLAAAANSRFSPYVNMTERYSDNVSLSSTAPVASFVTEVNPGFRYLSKGGKGDINLDYSLGALMYTQGGSSDTNHQLSLIANSELFSDQLKINAVARISQQFTSQTGAASGGSALLSSLTGAPNNANYYSTSNKTTSQTLGLTPQWRMKFGNSAQLDARWQITRASTRATSGGASTRSSGNNINLDLTSGGATRRAPWSVNYSLSESGSPGSAKTRLTTLSGTLGYQYSNKTRFNLTFGQDSNNGSTSGLSSSEGPYWNLGASWAPSSRLTLEASAGRRRNASSYSLNLNYRHRRFTLATRYSESMQDTYSQLTATEAFDIYLCQGSTAPVAVNAGSGPPAENCTLSLAAAPVQVSNLTSAISLSKAWSGNLSYNLGGGNLLTLALSSTQRDLLGSATAGDSDSTFTTGGAWSLRMGPRMTSVLSLSKSHAEGAGSESDDRTLGWMLTRQLGQDATGVIDLRRLERTSGASTGAFSENSISARVNMSF